MGLRIDPNPTHGCQPFHFTSPFILCYAQNSAEKENIYPSMLKTCGGINTFMSYRLSYEPARSQSRYCRENGVRLQACGANFDELSDEETRKQMLNLIGYDKEIDNKTACTLSETSGKTRHIEGEDNVKLAGIQPEPPQWPERDEVLRTSIQRRANRMEIPISLRIIKRKQQWEKSLKKAGGSTDCSMKRAFSSMVFIIRELQRCALQIRGSLYSEDLRRVVEKVERELNASFVWAFQHVLSRTPTLMVYVMILLANSTACSLNVVPVEMSDISLLRNWELMTEEEVNMWDSVVEEASRMQAEMSGEALDHKTKQHLVSPVSVELEPDDYEDYFRTDLFYQLRLSREPNNTLLLSNYAQYLHLVAHDNDRAEECFKRALQVDPMDAAVLCRYADFLWMARKDLWAAEEKYEQAMEAERGNPYYSSKYSTFIWITDGEDTCLPLNTFYDDYNNVW